MTDTKPEPLDLDTMPEVQALVDLARQVAERTDPLVVLTAIAEAIRPHSWDNVPWCPQRRASSAQVDMEELLAVNREQGLSYRGAQALTRFGHHLVVAGVDGGLVRYPERRS